MNFVYCIWINVDWTIQRAQCNSTWKISNIYNTPTEENARILKQKIASFNCMNYVNYAPLYTLHDFNCVLFNKAKNTIIRMYFSNILARMNIWYFCNNIILLSKYIYNIKNKNKEFINSTKWVLNKKPFLFYLT